MRVGTNQELVLSLLALAVAPRCSIWVALAIVAQLAGTPTHVQAAAAASDNSCDARQVLIIDPQAGSSCSIAFTPGDAFVVRVEQRDIDVTVSLQDASGRQAVAVDSPTKRASTEVLLAGPRLSGSTRCWFEPRLASPARSARR